MQVLNIRVDDRLVHGVVATNWIPRLRVDRAVVIDKESANNQMLKSVLRMATPKNVNLSVITVEKALENFKVNKYGNEKLIIVVKSLKPIIELLEAGFPVEDLVIGNLGNQEKDETTVKLTKYVSVNSEIIPQIKKVNEYGTHIVAQLIPEDDAEDVIELMKKKELL